MTDAQWQLLRRLFVDWTGVTLPHSMQIAAAGAVARAAAKHHEASEVFLSRTRTDLARKQQLIDLISVGTTWFLREGERLTEFVNALAERSAGRTFTIWSVGCSSGEEPFSLAMLAADRGVETRILATDVNKTALVRAIAGRYPTSATARVPDTWRERHFEPAGEGWTRVTEKIRKAVVFELHNLHTHRRLPPRGWIRFDAIVCRNVLMYFDPGVIWDVVKDLAAHLTPGGLLLLGPTERPFLWNHIEAGRGAILYKTPTGELARLAGAGEPTPSIHRRTRETTTQPLSRAIHKSLVNASQLEKSGRRSAAISLLEHTVSESPHDGPVHLALGLSLKRAGRLADAVTVLRAASALIPDGWLPPYQLAVCLEVLGEAAEARRGYQRAAQLLEAGAESGHVVELADLKALAPTIARLCTNKL